MARIVKLTEVGDSSVLKLVDEPVQEPKEGEVRIRVQAIGLNRAEVLFRQGRYLEKPIFPARIGYEASGVVEAVGPGVSEFKVGDKVSTIPSFKMSKYGVYGENVVVPASSLAHYPDSLTPEEGASIWMQFLTAYGALVEYGNIGPSDYVLITAASSSVGFAAIQICLERGAIPIASTRGSAKKQTLLDAGAKHVIVTNEEDLVDRVMSITDKKGCRIIFDAIAGDIVNKLAQAAAYQGTIFEYGALSLAATPFPLMMALDKGLTVRGYTLFQITSDPAAKERGKKYVYEGLKSGKLKPVIDKVFPFDQIAQSQDYMESNQQNGKIIVKL